MNLIINDVYIPLLNTDKRFVEVLGGRRSGKSVAIEQIIVVRALRDSWRRMWGLRKVGKDIRKSIWEVFLFILKDMGIYDQCHINKTLNQIILPNKAEINCMGLDDPERAKSLAGATDIWLEEATEFDEIDLDTLNLGLSPVNCGGTIWLTHNPIPRIAQSLTWIEERFLTKKEIPVGKIIEIGDDTLVLKTTYKHNKFCSQAVIDQLEKLKETNPDLYRMWALGEYVEMKGVILSDYDIVDSVPDHAKFLSYGLDFGFSNDPAACVKVWKHEQELWVQGIVYVTGCTSSMLTKLLIEKGVGVYDEIKADSAAPEQIQSIYDCGLKGIVKCQKHANYKFDASQMLKSFKIHIVGDNKEMISEFATWCYRKDKNGKEIPKVTDGNDHYIDALIYAVYNKSDNFITFLNASALGL